ncbi:FkbM family methyltransferase [Myxosarcina sp. GI1]|uniref:FkbM family methyltransferase n=1 Tax=Myxosarcina sp. GI1 TaxID=1541065 RepID=UPI000562CD86|nr:FkbM family methyltransferase [Myxosarcina sp. GI1]
MARKLIKKLLRNLGIEIKRYLPKRSEMARMQHFFSYYGIDLVLDVGANIGEYALLLRDLDYKGQIVSFEPLSKPHAQLVAASDRDIYWEAAPRMAIGDKDGEITINISANDRSSSVLDVLEDHVDAAPNSAYVDSEIVKLSSLDTIAPKYLTTEFDSVFLKIDVQGFERQVLAGATKILPRIKGIQIELSLVPLYQGQPHYIEMLKFLEQLGYELHAVIPGFTDPKTGRLLQMDGIFFRK